MSDAEEAKTWTNPWVADALVDGETAWHRRQHAVMALRVDPPKIDGKSATPTDLLAADERVSQALGAELTAESQRAEQRVASFVEARGWPLFTSRSGGGSERVADVRNGIPEIVGTFSDATNTLSNLPALWPGGAVGSNVTGSGKACGWWELTAPRTTHQELAGRITLMETFPFNANDPHPTMTAGFIAASGLVPSLKGAAYQASINSWSDTNSLGEIAALTTANFVNMRASNHSYGKLVGWYGGFFQEGNSSYGPYAVWQGDLGISNAATGWESHFFGLYDAEAASTDSTSNTKAYHLIVASSGNDRTNTVANQGYTFSLYQPSYNPSNPAANYKGEFIYTFRNGVSGLFDYVYFWPVLTPGQNISLLASLAVAIAPAGLAAQPYSAVLPNDGGTAGYDSLPRGKQTSKNALCVGAMKDATTIASYSAWGPTDDGRVKPDVVALGGDSGALVTSTSSASDTAAASGAGTSFSGPTAAGAVTLLSQYQETLRGNKEPYRASTFRALVIHSATDVAPTGPDFKTGWGILNAQGAADIIKTNTSRSKVAEFFLENNTSASFPFKGIGGQPVKITVTWADKAGPTQPEAVDPPGTASPFKVLVNDLDLRLARVSPTQTLMPWKPDPTNPGAATIGTGDNDRDNVEQIVLSNPVANEALNPTIAQKAGTSLTGQQWVSVVMTGVVSPYASTYETTKLQETYTMAGGNTLTATVTFGSVLGGYYKLQYVPYGTPPTNWQDASGIINARTDATTSMVQVSSPGILPFRVIAVAPNPFNLP